ncbi:MAG: GNAT family N-acetyltransferase [Cellulosilyticaceae bacterium]
MNNGRWHITEFNNLKAIELYNIMKVRNEVFVVEQEICCENDIDDRDIEAIHIYYEEDGQVLAYGRLLLPGVAYDSASIGRVLVDAKFRGKGLAKKLLEQCIDFIVNIWKEKTIVISAQEYAVPLYKQMGFKPISDVYDEAGISHIKMKYDSETL